MKSPHLRAQTSNCNKDEDQSARGWVLTVIAERATEGGHAAVTAEAIPLLQAHALIGTRVLLAGCAGPCNTIQKKLGFLL